MRAMKKHIKGGQNVDYYECTNCGWAYPAFSGSTQPSKESIPTKDAAQIEFETHDCRSFPRSRKAAN